LTDQNIFTFENKGEYTNPTEVIAVNSLKTVRSDDNPISYIFV